MNSIVTLVQRTTSATPLALAPLNATSLRDQAYTLLKNAIADTDIYDPQQELRLGDRPGWQAADPRCLQKPAASCALNSTRNDQAERSRGALHRRSLEDYRSARGSRNGDGGAPDTAALAGSGGACRSALRLSRLAA